MDKLINKIVQYIRSKREKRYFMERGEDMYIGISNEYGNKSYILYNRETGEKYEMLDKNGYAIFINDDDFLMSDKYSQMHQEMIKKRYPQYGFSIEYFKNGVACVIWTIQPDGRYWADDDGYGGTDDVEENLVAYINKLGKVVVPFQWVSSFKDSEAVLRKKAENINKRNIVKK